MNQFIKWLKSWVVPEDEPKKKGKMHVVTPDGKTEVIADLENNTDAEHIKELIGILFSDK